MPGDNTNWQNGQMPLLAQLPELQNVQIDPSQTNGSAGPVSWTQGDDGSYTLKSDNDAYQKLIDNGTITMGDGPNHKGIQIDYTKLPKVDGLQRDQIRPVNTDGSGKIDENANSVVGNTSDTTYDPNYGWVTNNDNIKPKVNKWEEAIYNTLPGMMMAPIMAPLAGALGAGIGDAMGGVSSGLQSTLGNLGMGAITSGGESLKNPASLIGAGLGAIGEIPGVSNITGAFGGALDSIPAPLKSFLMQSPKLVQAYISGGPSALLQAAAGLGINQGLGAIMPYLTGGVSSMTRTAPNSPFGDHG
jgi:hypothetical protein